MARRVARAAQAQRVAAGVSHPTGQAGGMRGAGRGIQDVALVGRVGAGQRLQRGVEPLDAQQLMARAQQRHHFDLPQRGIDRQRLQVLGVATQPGAQVGQRIGGIAVQRGLHLLGLVSASQPDHGGQQCRHQQRQQQPEKPALPERSQPRAQCAQPGHDSANRHRRHACAEPGRRPCAGNTAQPARPGCWQGPRQEGGGTSPSVRSLEASA